MKPVFISASTREWIDCKEHPYPQDIPMYPAKHKAKHKA